MGEGARLGGISSYQQLGLKVLAPQELWSILLNFFPIFAALMKLDINQRFTKPVAFGTFCNIKYIFSLYIKYS